MTIALSLTEMRDGLPRHGQGRDGRRLSPGQPMPRPVPAQGVAADRLAAFLPAGCFPAERDELLEIAVHGHAPPALLQVLLTLPPGGAFADLSALLHAAGCRA